MKNIIYCFIVLLSITSYAQTQKEYELDTQKSIINWTGSYLFQFSEHTGTVIFKNGTLITKNGNITGGSFTIDMQSISTKEYEKNNDHGPVGHLKNSDFFDVEVYPEAQLNLTKITYYSDTNTHRFEGDLTIKGIKKPIMIKAMVDDTTKTVKTKFKIDRQDWGISYQSKYKDSAISDAIEFDVTLYF